MAFDKFANAGLVRPSVSLTAWTKFRHKVASKSAFNQRDAASVNTLLGTYDPKQYLLSHCTIIASVNLENAPNATLGRQMVNNFQIDRKYADYRVTKNTLKYINNNNDAWGRDLLLSSFKTFTGGENYVEHIQIPELSKGKIIDSAARDIGDSIYVDILVATDRKHASLIQAITSGQLKTLSMGCFLPGTPVTMADGTRLPIEEVQPGSMVLTHKGRAREVLNQQIRGGLWQMRRIKVRGVPDSIEATGTHPFYVLRPANVCACGCGEPLLTEDADPVRRMTKRFKVGHDKRILNPNGIYSLDEARQRQSVLSDIKSLKVEKVRADELQVGDYVIFPKLDVLEQEDPGTAKARLLGYFLAEGSFLKTKGTPTEVQFNFSLTERTTFVDEVVRLLREEFPGCTPWVQDREDRITSTVHVAGKDIAAWFKHHGGEYSHHKRLSLEAMQWSVASHKQLIGAWLNGDGHRHNGGHTVGTTTSYDLACQLHTLSVRCGIPVWTDCVFGGRTVTIAEAVSNGQALRHDETGKLAAFNIYFPQSASVALSDASTKAPRKGSRDRHLRVLDDKVIFPITEIESFSYEGFVYDIEVEEDHSYQVHGFGVSNCQVQFTICTKCGNVAYDETQLCPDIKYFKGNDFIDEFGQTNKIAELCGHVSAEPGSVRFIEASWVANPAFQGAVLRNILSPEDIAHLPKRLQATLSQPLAPARALDPNAMGKAAYVLMPRGRENFFDAEFASQARSAKIVGKIKTPTRYQRSVVPVEFQSKFSQDQGQDQGKDQGGSEDQDTDFGGEPEAGSDDKGEAKDNNKDPIQKAVDELTDLIRERAIEKVRKDISKQDTAALDQADENENDTLIKSAFQHESWRKLAHRILDTVVEPKLARRVLIGMILYRNGGWKRIAASGSFNGREILAVSRMIDLVTKRSLKVGEARVYRTVLTVNGMGPFQNTESYLAACRRVVGRDLTADESNALIDKGRLFALGS